VEQGLPDKDTLEETPARWVLLAVVAGAVLQRLGALVMGILGAMAAMDCYLPLVDLILTMLAVAVVVDMGHQALRAELEVSGVEVMVQNQTVKPVLPE